MLSEGKYKGHGKTKRRQKVDGDDKKEKKIHVILDEIAKMRGYKEKLIGKRKVRPIVQYVDFLLEKKYGFKIIKKGEKYYDRIKGDYNVAEEKISLIEQYIQLLRYKRIEGYKSSREYDEYIAEKEGFKSLREKEESIAGEMGLSVPEYHMFLAEERGFGSYEEYQKYVNGISAIVGTYEKLIPKEDFDDISKLIKDKWTKDHEKFILFCSEFWKDSLEPYFEKTKKSDAAVFVDNIKTELDKFHRSKPGSLNIYNIDDIAIGMSYCLEEKGVDAILSQNKKSITFRKR